MRKIRIIWIGLKMIWSGVSKDLVYKIIKYALEFEGIYDFMALQNEVDNKQEIKEILKDLEELIEEIEKCTIKKNF